MEFGVTHRDGSHRSIWERGQGVFAHDGSLSALEGFMTDVTQRYASQADSAFLGAIVQSSSDAIVGINLGGKVMNANSTFTTLSGYTMAEILDANATVTTVPPGWEEAHAIIKHARLENGTVDNHEVTIQTRNGRTGNRFRDRTRKSQCLATDSSRRRHAGI